MKFKQLINKVLVTGIFISNTGFSSLASTLPEDARYEAFEGNSIKIDDVLEENEVNVEIEGNTLVNLVKYNNISVSYNECKDYQILNVKPNQLYTIVVDITSNTADNGVWFSAYEFAGQLKDSSYYLSESIKGDTKIASNGQIGRFVLKCGFSQRGLLDVSRFVLFSKDSTSGSFTANAMVFEGNLDESKLPDKYFEGMKSVGQDDLNGHNIEVLSSNNAKGNKYFYETNGIVLPNGTTNVLSNDKYTINIGKIVIDGTQNFTPHRIEGSVNTYRYSVIIPNSNVNTKSNQNCLGDALDWRFDDSDTVHYKIGVAPNTLFLYIPMEYKDRPNEYFNENPFTLYYEYTNPIEIRLDKKDIVLKEPLRGLPNGVKDRIVKRNGKWFVERNCREIVLNGSENWALIGGNWIFDNTYGFRVPFADMVYSNHPNTLQCDKLPVYSGGALSTNALPNDIEMIGNDLAQIGIRILKTKLTTGDANGFKEWLQSNPITVVYQLAIPIYEPLKIEPILNLYTDITNISNDSIIPANMKITVDRVLNRAVESIGLAKVNPTVENLSRARMWVNLVGESVKKDELQSEVNNITNIADLQLDRKSASSNLDVYIKSENMLSLSLNTNSITFDGYSGTEDMEMLGAVNININSSLPYSLNAYMSSEISNSDKSETMPTDILNIRENSEGVYQRFDNTTDKIVLKDNCIRGNGLIHNIDLKLSSNLAHKADVYKTVIKFEAEQK